eukprot:656768-Alexandrium_andersonii.AAC.1
MAVFLRARARGVGAPLACPIPGMPTRGEALLAGLSSAKSKGLRGLRGLSASAQRIPTNV